MHTLNPLASRSYNSKVTNWRVLELKGLKQKLSHFLSGYEVLDAALNAVDDEIERTKKTYADYVKNTFGERLLKTIKEDTCLPDVDKVAWKTILAQRGGCNCVANPPCFNCTDPITEEELNSVGYTYKS